MKYILEDIDISILRLTQEGIPLVESPFKDISKISGINETEVVHRIKNLKNKGIIRRFGASINNRKAGINANAMIVWKVPQTKLYEVGETFAKIDRVTHCYIRKTVPDKWEFNLYTVLHSEDRAEIEVMVNKMSESVGIFDFKILFSSREFKKTSNGRITEQALEKLGRGGENS